MKIIIGLMFLLFQLSVYSIGVKPLVVDIEGQPGDIKEFTLAVIPGVEDERVKFSFYEQKQLESGEIEYTPSLENKSSIASWIQPEKSTLLVPAGVETDMTCRVKIPNDEGGSKQVIIMVEQVKDDKEQKSGMQIVVRYAVRIDLRINKPGLSKKIDVEELAIKADLNRKPKAEILINNVSEWDYLMNIEATLRDSNRRLVERLELKTDYQDRNNISSTRIYSKSKLRFTSEISKRLLPGQYTLRSFIKYGDKQKIITQKIDIKEGEYDFPTLEDLGYFTPSEEKVAVELKPGLRKTQKIMIQNELDSEYPTAVMYRDPENKYKYSVGQMIKLRSKNGLTMRKRGRQTYLFTMEVPKDAEPGSYHGTLILLALDETKKNAVYQREIPITLIAGNDFKYQVDAKSIIGQIQEKYQIISLNYKNNGNIFIKPFAEVVITDTEGKFIERLELELPEGVEKTLPLKEGILTGNAKQLKKGKYIAEIKIMNEGQELSALRKELIVEG